MERKKEELVLQRDSLLSTPRIRFPEIKEIYFNK